jgi:hypothetical protein
MGGNVGKNATSIAKFHRQCQKTAAHPAVRENTNIGIVKSRHSAHFQQSQSRVQPLSVDSVT